MQKVRLLIALLIFCLAPPLLAENTKRPNIILMMADDQGWGDVGYNGHPYLKTPHLDKMSAQGVTFTRFYAANAMCSPTRGSVYTGRHPYRYGITFAMKGMLEPYEIPITSVLKKQGYTTGHFGKWHMGTLSKTKGDQKRWGAFSKDPVRYYCPPWDRDVDVSFVTESKVPTWDPMKDPGPIKGKGKARKNAASAPGTNAPTKPYGNEYFTGAGRIAKDNLDGDDSRVMMDRAIPYIRNAVKQGKPFLAVIWFHTPHSPVVAGSKYKQMYKDRDINEQHYYGCISAMDEQIGRLRAELDTLKIADNTMLWYCSDNGPARQGSPRHKGITNGLSGFKLSLQEGGIRVPGLLVWPNRYPKPKTVTTPCVTTDYFPTILAALDIPLPKDRPYDGMNILPLIDDPTKTRDKPIGFLHSRKVWMEHQYKLMARKKGPFQLFDIIADPAEKNDLAKAKPEIVKRMTAAFEPWHKGVLADLKKAEAGRGK